jgi:hypothetical protein
MLLAKWAHVGLAVAGLLLGPIAEATSAPGFPRLAGVLISAPQNYESADYQTQIARLSLVVLNVWPGWNGYRTYNTTMQKVVENIKAHNPKELVFLYQSIGELQPDAPNSAFHVELGELNRNNWWLHSTGSSGSLVKSTYGTDLFVTNTTAYSSRNTKGDRFIDWMAKFNVQTYYASTPGIDGFYTDNVFWKPRVDGDWNRDGVTDRQSDPSVQAWFRQGYVAYFNDLKALMPGKYQIGNIADWGQPSAVIKEYVDQLNGGVMEGMIGYSWSPEARGGWSEVMAEYRKDMHALLAPKLAIFHQNGDPSDYQAFRYGFASCLMDDGYYYFSANDVYSGVNWFDEFDNALGTAVSAPTTVPWKNGVYRRDFANGIALVNPAGNGRQMVTLETPFKRISGKQAPRVNNGETTTSVTLNDRDGLILLRVQPSATSAPAGSPPK